MRALHFGRFYREHFGGTERHVGLLLRALREDIEVDNLVANERWCSDQLDVDGYRVYRAASIGIVASTAICPGMPALARRLYRERPYDIVHLHLPDPMSHLAWLGLPADHKLVLSWHSDIVRQRRLLRLYRPWLVRLVKRADAILVATPRLPEAFPFLRTYADPKRVHVVPFGLDYSDFVSESARLRGEAMRARRVRPVLVFALGRHVYYKGFEYLIQAVAMLDDVELWLGGTGPLSKSYRALINRLGASDRVRLLGRIREDELASYYHAADLFCLPSTEPSEAFGLVQLEAMAAGKPVVSCEIGTGVSYVNLDGVTGRVVPPRDPAALAAAFRELGGSASLRRTLGEAARHRALSAFNIAKMKDRTLEIYRDLVSGTA